MTSTTITSTTPAVFERRESVVRSYCRQSDATLRRGEGSLLFDVDGRRYIDFLAGAGSLNYGHNDPAMRDALVDYITSGGVALGLDLHTEAKARFLELFEELVLEPLQLDHRVHFTGPTGANAVEAALKLARKTTGRTNVIAFTNGFHGMSLGALAATGSSYNRESFAGLLSGVTRMPYDGYLGPDVDTAAILEKMLDDPSSGVDAPAAILVEGIQGEGGLNVASDRWLQAIAGLARRHGALLVVDDIQAGVGRSGNFFSFTRSGVVPDLVCLSKSISGFGLPMALLLVRPEVDTWRPAEHNGTFRGNQHAFVTAAAALDTYWRDRTLMGDVARRSDTIRAVLAGLADEVGDRVPGVRVKGRGMMLGLDLVDPGITKLASRAAYQRGVLTEQAGAHDEVLKIMAPLVTPDDLLAEGLALVEESVREAVAADRA